MVNSKVSFAAEQQTVRSPRKTTRAIWLAVLFTLMISSCDPLPQEVVNGVPPTAQPAEITPQVQPTATTRPVYSPGELVDYTAQPGDTLAALAVRFHSSVDEILKANPFIPADATTMPPGMPMKIPIYYQPFWGSAYQIIPDALFANGPAAVGFDIAAFLNQQPGWLKNYRAYVLGRDRPINEVIEYVSISYSVSPQLIIALTEYILGGLSEPVIPETISTGYVLGIPANTWEGYYRQISILSNELNTIYYSYRDGEITEFTLSNGQMVRPDPWQNAATVALQIFFARHFDADYYHQAISEEGVAAVFHRYFGDPWLTPPTIPGSLRQPAMRLPFQDGTFWTYTGGPHTPWGTGTPFGAIDFAPPAVVGGCIESKDYAVAVADGIVARTGVGIVVLDLDGDGDERTGWVLFYLHIATKQRIRQGQVVLAGQVIGHPSCEGGTSTGTHIHIARKYNGEWIPAGGTLAFNLDGWEVSYGSRPYLGYLERHGRKVTACECSDFASQIQADFR